MKSTANAQSAANISRPSASTVAHQPGITFNATTITTTHETRYGVKVDDMGQPLKAFKCTVNVGGRMMPDVSDDFTKGALDAYNGCSRISIKGSKHSAAYKSGRKAQMALLPKIPGGHRVHWRLRKVGNCWMTGDNW